MRKKNYSKKSSENNDKRYSANFDRLLEDGGYDYLSRYFQYVLASKNWNLDSDFDDVFHDSLIKARRKVPVKFGESLEAKSIEQFPELRNYLTRFFLQEVRNYFRVNERRYQRTRLMPINLLETMVFKDPRGEQLRQERLEEMYEQIAKMKPVLKEPLSMHLEGRSDEEICQNLRLKPQTVYNVLSMAKNAVINVLKYAFGSKT